MSTELISLLIALGAVVFGPLVQLYIAKAQIRAEVRSGNRQRWINELRNEIVEFMTANIDFVLRLRYSEGVTPDLISSVNSTWRHFNKTQLMINPSEPDHQELIELMRDTTFAASKRGLDIDTLANTIEGLNDKVAIAAQRVFKREWERVKVEIRYAAALLVLWRSGW